MDNNNGNRSQGGEPAMEAEDWRSQLKAESRQRIVNKIMETLKRHLPFSGQEGLVELQKIAVRFEEKIYAAATSQSDYLRKISLKMLTMETKSQNTMANSLQSNSAVSSVMQPQVTNQGQLSSENIESNIPPAGVQFSAGLSSAQAPTPALNMSSLVSALPPSPGSTAQQNMINPLQSNAGFLHNRYLQQQQQLQLMILQSQQRQLQEQLIQKNQNQTFQQKQQQEIQQLLLTSALSSSQSKSNMLQESDSLDSSSGKVAKQHQKQELEGKVVQNQLKQQPFQQLQMQQQWTQKPHMLQGKQQQQIQQLQQQAKQQLHHIYFIYLIFLAILLGAYLFRTGY